MTTGSVEAADGSRVLSIRIHAKPRPFDEQHFVTAPDGESRIFETSGDTQTVRDGETGEMLGRSTFTAQGAEPEARIQLARFGALVAAAEGTAAAAMALLSALSRQNDRNGTAARGLTATGFLPRAGSDFDTTWVGRLSREKLDAACPRAGEVKAIADEAAAYVRSQIEGAFPARIWQPCPPSHKGSHQFPKRPSICCRSFLVSNGRSKSFIRGTGHLSARCVGEDKT